MDVVVAAIDAMAFVLFINFIPFECLMFSGEHSSLTLLSFSVIHEINVPLMTATAIAIMNTLNALFGAITDPLIGWFLDLTKHSPFHDGSPTFSLPDYHLSFAIMPIYLVVCLILLKFIKETNCIQTVEDKP